MSYLHVEIPSGISMLPPIPPSLKPPMRFSIIYALYSQECLQHTFHSNGSYKARLQ